MNLVHACKLPKRQIQDLSQNEEIKQPSVNMCNTQDAKNARLDI